MPQAPQLEFAFEALAQVAPFVEIGDTPLGRQRMIPILGGHFEGPRIKGEILPGGHDWQFITPEGATELTAHYVMKASDGALIAVTNRGLRHAPDEVQAKLLRGEAVDPSLVYFRATPRFETAAPQHRWLNRHIFLCVGERAPSAVRLFFYAVL